MTFLGRPQADLAKTRAGLGQSALQLPASRGCQVAPTLALYGQNHPAKPSFRGSFLSILGPGGSVCLSLSSHWLRHQPGLPGPLMQAWGGGSPNSGRRRSLKIITTIIATTSSYFCQALYKELSMHCLFKTLKKWVTSLSPLYQAPSRKLGNLPKLTLSARDCKARYTGSQPLR